MATGDINIKAVLDASSVDTSLLGLKKSIRELSAIKLDILPKAQADAVRARIGQLINDSKDLRMSLSNMDAGDFAQNITKLMGPLVGGFTAAGAAAQLLGVENEGLNKLLQKTQQITIGLMSIQQIADADKLKSTALYIGMQIKSLFWTGAQTEATEGATVAQKALNIAMKLNPVGLIIAAFTALVAILLIYNKSQRVTTQYELDAQRAMDGTIIKSDELRKSYNDNYKTLRDLTLEYKKTSGAITEFGAIMEKLKNDHNDALYEINQDSNRQLAELRKSYDGFSGFLKIWGENLWAGFPKLITLWLNPQLKPEDVDKINKEIAAAEKVQNDKAYGIRQIAIAKQQDEMKLKLSSFNESRLKESISFLNSEYSAYSTSAKKIIDLYKNILKAQKDYQSRSLSPEEKSIDEINNYYDSYTTNLKDLNEQLEIEKINLSETEEKIKSTEKTLKLYVGTGGGSIDLLNKSLDTNKSKLKDLTQEKGGMVVYERWLELSEEIKGVSLEIEETQLDIANASISYNQIQTDLVTLTKNRNKYLKEQGKLVSEIKSISLETNPDDEAKREKKREEDLEKIRQKYANQRRQNILNDEKEINNIKSSYLDDIINNELLSEDKRKEALSERIKLLNEQIEIEKELLKIKISQIQADENLTQEEKDSKVELEIEKTKKVIDGSTKAVDDSTDALADSLKEKAKVIRDFIVDVLSEVGNAVTEIFARSISDNFEKLNYMLNKEMETAQKTLDNQLEAGLISQQQYDDEVEKMEETRTKKELDLKIKQFKQEKALTMVQIVIDTAAAVVKSWAQGGGILGGPIAAIAAIAGALQLAVVASQQPPEFEQGGLIMGNSHMNGGVPIVAEGNEYIVNKTAVSRPGVLNLLENINKGKQNSILDEASLEKIVSRIARIPVTNLESDYTGTQRRVKNMETRSLY